MITIELLFIRLSVILIAFINVYKDGVLNLFFIGVYIALLICATLPRILNNLFKNSLFKINKITSLELTFIAYIALILISYGRSIGFKQISSLSINSLCVFSTIIFFVFVVIRPAAYRRDNRYVKAIFQSFDLFLIINLAFYIVGVRGDTQFINSGDFGTAKLLSIIGIHHDRILFPFTPGLTVFGVLAGASFSNSVISLAEKTGTKKYNILIFILSSFSLLLADARGSIMCVFFALLIYFLLTRYRISIARYLVAPLTFFFILVILIMVVLSNNNLISDLSRGGGLLSGREFIWLYVFNYLSEMDPIMWIGHGFMGHFKSGVSYDYSYLFNTWGNPELATLHNTFLQNMFDVGIIGLTVLVVILQITVNSAIKNKSFYKEYSVKIIMLILYLELSGATESCISPYSFVTYMPVLFLVAFVIMSHRNKGSSEESVMA